MKAAILVKNKAPLIIADIEIPERLDYGQVLVRVHYSGICGAQINEIDAVKGEDKFLPHLLGHEGGGVVEKVGPGVTVVRKGDHVVMHWRKGNGIQSASPKYKWGKKTVNAGWVTTFNEYAIVSENRLTPIPHDYDLKTATLYGCALTTAFGVIHNDAKAQSGDSILIFGSGGVGAAIILAAKSIGLYPIVAVDINDYKLKKARKLGATYAVSSKSPPSLKLRGTGKISPFAEASSIIKVSKDKLGDKQNSKLLQLCPGGFDVAVDTTGIKEVREMAYELTNPTGVTVLVGVPRLGEKISIDSFPLHFDKRITGSHGGDTNPSYDIPRLIRLEKSGRFETNNLITHEYNLDEINKAIKLLRSGDVIKCIIKLIK